MKKFVILMGVLVVLNGCDFYTAKTVKDFDTTAAYSRNIADEINAGRVDANSTAYYMECFARAFANYADAGHWRKPTFIAAPTNRPTSLPWVPVGGRQP